MCAQRAFVYFWGEVRCTCHFYSDIGHFPTGVFIFSCALCRLENVMWILYFHEFNENLASGPSICIIVIVCSTARKTSWIQL